MLVSEQKWGSLIRALALSALAFACPLIFARADGGLKVPTAASLGFTESHQIDERGRSITQYRDRHTSYLLTIAAGPAPDVREETIFNPGGDQVYHAEIHADWRRTEGRIPSQWSTEIHALSDGRTFVSDMRLGPDGHYVTTDKIIDARAWKACADPNPVSDTDLSLLLQNTAQIVPLVADPSDAGKDLVRLGSNAVAKHCDKYPPGGVSSLIQAMGKALDQGLRCLSGLAQSHPGPLAAMWRMNAAQILGYFNSKAPAPFSIVCERSDTADPTPGGARDHMSKDPAGTKSTVSALALTCLHGKIDLGGTVQDFPGMALNLAGPDIGDETQMAPVIFHEMLHHLGYFHDIDPKSKAFDAVYAAEFCCFPASLKGTDNKTLSAFECGEVTHIAHGQNR